METVIARHWRELILSFGEWPGTIIVDGVDTGDVARAIAAAGGPALVNDADPLAVLTGPGYTDDPDELDEVPDAFADLLIVRWSWDGARGLADLFGNAARILRPGGRLLAMEPDDGALLGATPHRYPIRLLIHAAPDLLVLRGRRPAGRAALTAALIRGEFEENRLFEVDETRGSYSSPEELWDAASAGAWPALGLLGDRREPVMESVGVAMRRLIHGAVDDLRPWLAATGIRR